MFGDIMSMHLEGPWLSTTGKKKGKRKFASAEHARKAREQEESWKELQKKWGIEAEEKKRARAMSAPSLSSNYKLSIPEGRNTTAHIKSVDTGGNATLKPAKVYTGTKVKGIATMHKSNAVPVFSDEEAVEISKMRR
jgi:N-acetylglucosamine-6-phosphate deacetylase